MATVHVCDAAGRLVQTLLEEKLGTSHEIVTWRACREAFSCPTNVYFYRLAARPISGVIGQHVVTGKILLMR
ncbi:MAG: hypothetical protein ONB30_13060 [candidate division KSB1 bacterium]|nr:hypothetical protein [candidate division KSB1 bacterium]MDZ7386696.1 hypothetical protein [candidate division KSB1 bacterium]